MIKFVLNCLLKISSTFIKLNFLFIRFHILFVQVVEFMESKPPADNQPVHIINIDIQDNHEEATMGAFLICDLVAMVRSNI